MQRLPRRQFRIKNHAHRFLGWSASPYERFLSRRRDRKGSKQALLEQLIWAMEEREMFLEMFYDDAFEDMYDDFSYIHSHRCRSCSSFFTCSDTCGPFGEGAYCPSCLEAMFCMDEVFEDYEMCGSRAYEDEEYWSEGYL
jgi:hypothetical protein